MSNGLGVYIVDDDDAVRESLGALLESHGFSVKTFASADDFLSQCGGGTTGCLLADVRMPGMDGLELQEQITLNFPNLAVIIITGHGDVPIAVRAMKGGAMDFVEKPFVEETIVASVRQALEQTSQSRRHASDAITATARLKLLTAREREVLNGLVAGLPNKTIAADLGISPRTVEIHRAHVMGKMQADSLSSLVRMAIAAGALN